MRRPISTTLKASVSRDAGRDRIKDYNDAYRDLNEATQRYLEAVKWLAVPKSMQSIVKEAISSLNINHMNISKL